MKDAARECVRRRLHSVEGCPAAVHHVTGLRAHRMAAETETGVYPAYLDAASVEAQRTRADANSITVPIRSDDGISEADHEARRGSVRGLPDPRPNAKSKLRRPSDRNRAVECYVHVYVRRCAVRVERTDAASRGRRDGHARDPGRFLTAPPRLRLCRLHNLDREG